VNDAEIDAAIAVHEAAIEALRELRRVPMPVAMSVPAAVRKQSLAKRRWELAARAFKRFPFEPHIVRRICANNPEWAARLTDGCWYIDFDRFNKFADKVDRGEAWFESSGKFASSLANRPQLNETKHIGKSIAEEDDSD
jgi:hypothetical protein